jgi:plastocyanin
MGKPGIIAFPVLLALGAITGYLTYSYFMAAMPQEGFVDSPYRQELTASAGNETGTGGKEVDKTQYSKVVTIRILQGALTQGSPDYEPDAATASSDALITWVNDDSTLHTATSGVDTDDPESGNLFDSKFLGPDGNYSIPASEIGPGVHSYYCTLHTYMKATITVE